MLNDTLHKTSTNYNVWGFDTTVKTLGPIKAVIGRIEVTHFDKAVGGDTYYAWSYAKRRRCLGHFSSIQDAYDAINKANDAFNAKYSG